MLKHIEQSMLKLFLYNWCNSYLTLLEGSIHSVIARHGAAWSVEDISIPAMSSDLSRVGILNPELILTPPGSGPHVYLSPAAKSHKTHQTHFLDYMYHYIASKLMKICCSWWASHRHSSCLILKSSTTSVQTTQCKIMATPQKYHGVIWPVEFRSKWQSSCGRLNLPVWKKDWITTQLHSAVKGLVSMARIKNGRMLQSHGSEEERMNHIFSICWETANSWQISFEITLRASFWGEDGTTKRSRPARASLGCQKNM